MVRLGGTANNNRSDLIEWLFDEWAGTGGNGSDYEFENIENEATGLDIYAGMFLEPTVEFVSFILDSVMSVLTSVMTQEKFQYVMVTEESLEKLPDLGSTGASYTIEDMTPYQSIKYKFGLLQYPYFKYSPEEIFAGNIELLDINFISGSNNDDGWNKIRNVISQWYQILRMVTIIGLLSVLIYTGIKIMISSNTKDKAKYKELIANWFIGVILAFSMHYIIAFILTIIEEFLGLLKGITGLISVNANINFKTNLMGLARFQMQQQHFTAKVGYLIIYTALVVYTFKFTFLYLKRVLNMAFLTMISPIVALTYPIDKANDGKAQGFEMWLKEFLYNALLQPVHYILYYILVTSSLTLAARNPIYGIVVLAFLSQAEKLLKKIFGFDKARAGTAGGIAGAFATGAITSSLMKLGGGKGKSKEKVESSNNHYNNDMEGIQDVIDDTDWYGYLDTPSIVATNLINTQNQTLLGINNAISTYRNEIPENELEELSFDDGFGGMQSLLRQIYQCENKLEDQTLSVDKREKLEEKLFRLKTALQNRLEFNESGFEEGLIPTQYADGDSRTNAELASDVMNSWRMAREGDKNEHGMNARRTMQKLKRRMAENQYIQKQGGPQSLWQQERKDMLESANNKDSETTTSSPVTKGLKNVGKQISKPVWDFEKDGKYNRRRLAGKVIKGVTGATLGVAAATVQAGISITDGKYNPIEGVATVAAGVAGASQIGKGNQKGKDIETVEKYGEQWFNRDDVISNYNREFPGQGKEMRRRAVENYISRGITDFNDQKQAIKYANVLKKERGMDEKEADKLAIATLQYKKSLASNKNYTILFDEGKKEKYLDLQADAYTGASSRDSVKKLHNDFIENVREFNKANE